MLFVSAWLSKQIAQEAGDWKTLCTVNIQVNILKIHNAHNFSLKQLWGLENDVIFIMLGVIESLAKEKAGKFLEG